jgi:hypothetical protein
MARRGEVIERDLGWDRIKREINEAARLDIRVGVPSEETEDYDGRAPLVLVAAVNEFGNERIPSRSALRDAFDNNITAINGQVDRLYNGILIGTLTAGRAAAILGQYHEDQQRQSILDLSDPENAQSTKDQKGSDNPLVDTGRYAQSVRYVVDS